MTANVKLYIVHTNAYSILQTHKTSSLEQLNFEASGPVSLCLAPIIEMKAWRRIASL